jgi:NAD(P)-dependent dehydrogenase (short-subunit alcohol dehydrogenase family)
MAAPDRPGRIHVTAFPGIGTETARALASAGAEVVLAVRRRQAARQIAADIVGSTGNTKISVAALDLSDQDSVRRFAASWDQPLHILVNNAGVIALVRPRPRQRRATLGHRTGPPADMNLADLRDATP